MTLKSTAQINVMSSIGSYDAAHLRTTSSPTFTSESSGASVMPVASDGKKSLQFAKREKSAFQEAHGPSDLRW